jgi:hypothetical protein
LEGRVFIKCKEEREGFEDEGFVGRGGKNPALYPNDFAHAQSKRPYCPYAC